MASSIHTLFKDYLSDPKSAVTGKVGEAPSRKPIVPREDVSAGVLLFNHTDTNHEGLEVFLVKPGGPFYEGRARSWGMPKGGLDKGESALDAAKRELLEETGIVLDDPDALEYLGKTYESYGAMGGKTIHAYAYDMRGNRDIKVNSQMLTKVFNGKEVTFPETGDGRWFSLEEADDEIRPAQATFIDQLWHKYKNQAPA